MELVVNEPVPGNFYWSVLGREVFGEPRRTLDRAPMPFSSHHQAVTAGAIAMRRHMEPKPMRAMPFRAAGLRHEAGPESVR